MATVSSHVLDSVHGASAAGIQVILTRIGADGTRIEIFSCETDDEGRISQSVQASTESSVSYELEFQTAPYFRRMNVLAEDDRIMQSVIVRIAMTDPDKRYHIPVMASPHSYSLWWSS